MKWKSIFAVGFAALLAIGSGAGCASGQTNESLTVWVADPDLAQKRFSYAMYQFKQDHPDVEVQFAEAPEPVDMMTGGEAYEEYKNVTLKEYADQLRVEVMGRSGPDLILFDENTFPNLYKTVASGVFAPLDSFIEGDETFQQGALGGAEPCAQAVMDAGVYKGKQYFIPLGYSMPMVMSGREPLQNCGISTDKPVSHSELLAKAQENAESMAPGIGGQLEDILLDGVIEINYYEKTYSVDRERLEKLCDTYRVLLQYPDTRSANMYREMAEGERFCYVFPREHSSWINITAAINYYGEPYLSPMLNADGEIPVYLEMGAAINAYSPNQRNAYEFLKYAMQSDGYGAANYPYMDIPANQAAIDKWLAYVLQTDQPYDGSSGGVPSKPMPEEYYDQIREWNQSIGEVYIDTGLDEQMQEWFQPYFRGEQSFDSCYQAMENALEIMISE